MSAAATTPSFADLPEAAMACILEHVPLQQRLSRCALVCRSWAAAAAAVPAHVDVQLHSPEQGQQLSAWLEACGQQVVSLTAAGEDGLSLQLPCHQLSRLHSLQLSDLKCHLMLTQGGAVTRSRSRAAARGSSTTAAGSAAGAAGEAVLLPQLRELCLSYARMSRHDLLQLSALSRLSQLHMDGLLICNSNTEQRVAEQQQAATVRGLLQHLAGLSDLLVKWCGELSSAQLVEPISAMQRLQRLQLTLASDGSQPLLAALPVSLTALVIAGSDQPSATAAAELTRLTNLQHLSTQSVTMQPAVVAGLTWLRHLCLLSPYKSAQAPAGAPALLAALGHLTQLRHLELKHCWLGNVQQQQQQQQVSQQQQSEDGWQCFSALTASTQLTALRLVQSFSDPLPGPAALDHMLPAGRVLPHLAILHLQRLNVFWNTEDAGACVGGEQVARVAASCPALQRLVLVEVTPPYFDTACLDQLPPGVTWVKGLDWQRPAPSLGSS